jgi:hypothetical protein
LGNVKIDFNYNFKDILAIPAGALKAKKIFVMALGLLGAFLFHNIFLWLADSINGSQSDTFYTFFSLVPITIVRFNFFYPILVYSTGLLLAIISIAIGFTAVAIIDFEAMRGNQFLSWWQAIKFSLRKLRQLVLSWLAIMIFIGFIVLLAFLVGLIARIPYIGEIIYSLFFFFPNFIVALFTVLAIFVLILSVLVMPAAVAADKNDETFNSILETFSTIIRRPFRWILYTFYSLIAAKVCGFVFAYFAFRAVQFLQIAARLGGGEKINSIVAAGAAHLPYHSELVKFTTNIFPGIDFGFDIGKLFTHGGNGGVASYIMAISLSLIFLTIWAYIFSIIATAQSYGFAVIRKNRDGHAIGDERPLFYKEEWVNPPIDDETLKSKGNNTAS